MSSPSSNTNPAQVLEKEAYEKIIVGNGSLISGITSGE